MSFIKNEDGVRCVAAPVRNHLGHNQGIINEDQLRKYVSWLIDKGVNGLFPLGSVGEFVHMSFDEKVKVMEIVVDEAAGRVPVVPGTAESCFKAALDVRGFNFGKPKQPLSPADQYNYSMVKSRIHKILDQKLGKDLILSPQIVQ